MPLSVAKQIYIDKYSLDERLPACLVAQLELKGINKNEYLCHQNHPLGYVYLLVEGKLQVDYLRKTGHQSVLSFETPLSIIGELEVFNQQSAVGNVKAIDTSLVLAISANTLKRDYFHNPQFLNFINQHLRERVTFLTSLLPLASDTVEMRLCRYLIYRQKNNGDQIQLENREAISALLGISMRHLNRTLKDLEHSGVIKVKNKTLTILKLELLEHLSESSQ